MGTESGRGPERGAGHAERLYAPWWLWLVGLGITALVAAEVGLGAPGLRTWVPYVVLLPLAAVGLWWVGRIRVAVEGDEFKVDDARLPLRFVADAIPLDAAGRRELLGVHADPLAFVVQRPWVRGTVQVVLNDSDDPTPYWVISSRRPERLAAALLARNATHPGPIAGR
ncbi:DUF3093 domain-containing protein [Rhizomonospora bruguierae]|uniref:DUF3093 domain-containing protein n=1 Tax=Rhizomonospora bruguierae TaxID=1581705 RepID=UPI0020BDCF56|nr:DUF3093 domain-containing protein [Micromonospora sp. NBRC 107566]